MKLTLERGLPSRGRTTRTASDSTTSRHRGHRGTLQRCGLAFVSSRVLCGRCCAGRAPRARADDRRAGARLQARAGHAVVGDAGAAAGDRLRSEPRSAACRSIRRSATSGRDRPARRLLRRAAGRAGVRLLRLPDALHAGAERRCRARSTCCRSTPGKDFEVVTVSFDPRETPAPAAAKKAVYLERYKRPGAADGWHFLTGDQPSIERADAGRRLPLRLGRADQAVRAPDAASSC